MDPIVDSAIAHYHELLAGGHWQSTHELLFKARQEYQLHPFNSKSFVMRPLFLDAATYAAVQEAALQVARAIVAVGERVRVDAALRARLCLTPGEEARVQAEVDPQEPYSRLDGLLGESGGVRFLEYNTMPGGAHTTEQIARVFDELPVLGELRKRFRVRHPLTERRIIPSCLRAHHARGGSGMPNVAVALTGVPTESNLTEEEGRYQLQAAMEAGVPIRLVDGETLEYRDGRLYSGDFAVDCITYVDWRSFLTTFPMSHGLWRAVREGSVFFFGSFSILATRGNKGIFALLSDPEIVATLAPELRAAVARHVPWTRMVADSHTEMNGERIDLVPFIAGHRERFVLKPTNQRAGEGVVLGWENDAATWEATLKRALDGQPHVVQERVTPSRSRYPIVIDERLELIERNEDCNPFVWNSAEVEGALTRVSGGGMLNLHAGGMITPLYIVEPS